MEARPTIPPAVDENCWSDVCAMVCSDVSLLPPYPIGFPLKVDLLLSF